MFWVPVLVVGGLIIAGMAHKNRKRAVFVSYCHTENAHYRNLMMAWDANDSIEFKFDLASPRQAIPSKNVQVIRAELDKLMAKADCLLVIVGQTTEDSTWVDWEVQVASKRRIPIVAVKIDRSYSGPPSLYSAGAIWVNGFEQAAIMGALKRT